MKFVLSTLAALCMLLHSHTALAAQPDTQPVRTVDRIVAIVNKGVITQHDLNTRVSQVEANLKRQNIPLPPPGVLAQQVLERMVTEQIQLEYAANNGIRVDDAELDQTIARIASNNHVSPEQLKQKVVADGLTFKDFREEIRRQVIIDRVREREIDSKTNVTDSEVDNYLASAVNANQTEYRLAHIMVSLPEQASPQVVAERSKRAEEAAAKLAAGANFSQVAASYSDARDALSGGELGWRTATRLPSQFIDAIKTLPVDGTTQVIRLADGFHILKVLEKRTQGESQMVTQTHARHILVKVNEATSEAEAHQKILQIRDRILNHSITFAEAARLYSEDGSASRGGDLNWITPGDMVPQFEQAMSALKPNEVSEPVRSPFGWHLIEVIGTRSQDVGRDMERQRVRQELRARKSEQAYEDWVRQLRDSAYVVERLQDK